MKGDIYAGPVSGRWWVVAAEYDEVVVLDDDDGRRAFVAPATLSEHWTKVHASA